MTAGREIIVYQPGKVGSSAIMFALQRAGFAVSHIHMLSEERLRGLEISCLANGEPPPRYIDEARRVRRDYIEKGQRMRIVSAVRDPVARNLSAFFENINSFCPEWRKLRRSNVNEISMRFLAQYPHHVAIDWFDAEFKDVLDIDVYQYEFCHERGYGLYSSDFADVIVLRAEDGNRVKSEALCKFLSIEKLRIREENRGLTRHWGDTYREVKKSIRFPESYLDEMYDSKMAKYFYTDQERNDFRLRHTQA